MPRRRKRKESELDALLSASWQLSAGLAVFVLVMSQMVIPFMIGTNPFAPILVSIAKTFGLLAATILAVIALALYFKQRTKLADSPTQIARQSYAEPSDTPSVLRPVAADRIWNESLTSSRNEITPDTGKPSNLSALLR